MLTVVTPASSTALTTANRALAMLGLPGSEERALELVIPVASQMVVDHCRRPFAAETVRETFRSPRGGLLLARAPVNTIISVSEGDATLDPADYELDGETLWRVSHNCRLPWIGSIAVTYSAGYVLPGAPGIQTLPSPVEQAVILIVGAILSGRTRDPMLRSETVEGVGSTSWWIPSRGSLPSREAEDRLAPYCRIVG